MKKILLTIIIIMVALALIACKPSRPNRPNQSTSSPSSEPDSVEISDSDITSDSDIKTYKVTVTHKTTYGATANTKVYTYEEGSTVTITLPSVKYDAGADNEFEGWEVVDASGNVIASYGVNQTSITIKVTGNLTIRTKFANKSGWTGNY